MIRIWILSYQPWRLPEKVSTDSDIRVDFRKAALVVVQVMALEKQRKKKEMDPTGSETVKRRWLQSE